MIQIDEKKYEITSTAHSTTIVDNKYRIVFNCGAAIDVIQFSKEEKDYFMALSRLYKTKNQMPSIILSNNLTNSCIQIPMSSECLIDRIKLQEASYSVDGISCVEISVPVKFSNIEDCLTYIFYKDCDSEIGFPFVGVVSSYLDSFIKPSGWNALVLNDAENCTSSEDLEKLIEKEYLPNMHLLDLALTQQKQDERNKFFEKNLGSRFKPL